MSTPRKLAPVESSANAKDVRLEWMRAAAKNIAESLAEIDDRSDTMSAATLEYFLQSVTSEARIITQLSLDIRKGR